MTLNYNCNDNKAKTDNGKSKCYVCVECAWIYNINLAIKKKKSKYNMYKTSY